MTRPYEIKDNQTGEIVLVEGSTPSNALLALTRDRFVVTTPSASRVAELLRKTDTRFLPKEVVEPANNPVATA
jgi:hypothetical protein